MGFRRVLIDQMSGFLRGGLLGRGHRMQGWGRRRRSSVICQEHGAPSPTRAGEGAGGVRGHLGSQGNP